jgi:hypothetical protein
MFCILCDPSIFHGFPFDMLWQPAVGPDGSRVEAEGNVLLASIENMQYAVSVDVLHTVSKIGETLTEICLKILVERAYIVLIMINLISGVLCIWRSPENCYFREEWWNTSFDSVPWYAPSRPSWVP